MESPSYTRVRYDGSNWDNLSHNKSRSKNYSNTFDHSNYQRKRTNEEDDELSQRIASLKNCIKEIEQKQEHLLNRIDTRINSKPKYEYEEEEDMRRASTYYSNPSKEEEYSSKAKEYERKIFK